MNKEPLISVIVPIYGVEQYLRQCIESILGQTYTNFELILVDDGSPDKCPSICEEYKSKDSRIKVVHKTNGGLVSARKAGLLESKGDYILNVDGDDFIEPTMIEEMIKSALMYSADIVITGYTSFTKNNKVQLSNAINSDIYTNEKLDTLFDSLLFTGKFYEQAVIPAVWNKLFRREVYYEYQMNVPDEITMGEDFAVSYPSILNSKCIVINNDFHPYNYRIVENSMSRQFNKIYFDKILNLFNYITSIFPENYEQQLCYYKIFLLKIGCDSFLFTRKFFQNQHYLKKILKNFSIKKIVSSINLNFFNTDEKRFIKSLKSENFTYYVFHHYLIKALRHFFNK